MGWRDLIKKRQTFKLEKWIHKVKIPDEEKPCLA